MRTVVERIVLREVEAVVVYESERVIAFLDHDPIQPGHVLVCPTYPYQTLVAMPESVAREVFAVVRRLYRRIEAKYQPDGLTILQNNGQPNELDHVHVHVIPRYRGDGFGAASKPGRVWTQAALRAEAEGLYLDHSQP